MTVRRVELMGLATWLAGMLVCPGVGLAGPGATRSGAPRARSGGAYVIPSGNEQRLLRLLRPYSLTRAAPDRWRVAGVRLQGETVRVQLTGPGDGRATVVLLHPAAAPRAECTASFAFRRLEQRGAGASAAVTRLLQALRRNDDGTWARQVWTPSQRAPRSLRQPPAEVTSSVTAVYDARGWLQGLCVALLILALLMAIRGDPDGFRGARLRLPATATLQTLALYAGLTVGLWLLLWWIAPSAPLYEDTVRDLLLGRDCLGGHCAAGAESGVLQLRHPLGAYHLIALLLRMGIPIEQIHLAACGLHALAVTLVLWTARRVLDPGAAALAAALFGSVVLSAVRFPVLWHPSGLPLGIALFAAGVVGVTRDPRWRWSLILAAGAAVCVEAHPTAWLLLVLGGAGLLAVARHPVPDGLGYLGVVLGIPVTLSWEPLRSNLTVIGRQVSLGPLGLAALVGVVGVGLGLALRIFMRRLDRRGRLLVWLLLLAGAYLVAVVLARGWWRVPTAQHHQAPVALPCSLLGAWALTRIMGWLRFSARQRRVCLGMAVWALVLSFGAQVRAPWSSGLVPPAGDVRSPRYSLTEVARLSTHLRRRGWRRGELLRRVRGPRSQDLSAGLLLWAREPTVPPLGVRRDLRVLRVGLARAPGRLPPPWLRLTLGDRTVALLGALRPWVRLLELSWCQRPAGGRSEHCRKLHPKRWSEFGGSTRFGRFAQGHLAVLPGASGGYTLRIPVVVRGRDPARYLELLPEWSQEGSARWRIVALEGISGSVAGAGQCASLAPRAGERGGTLVLRSVPAPVAVLRLPQVFESRPGEGALRGLLRRGGERDGATCGR